MVVIQFEDYDGNYIGGIWFDSQPTHGIILEDGEINVADLDTDDIFDTDDIKIRCQMTRR